MSDDDYDADGRPTVDSLDQSWGERDPLLERLYRIHKAPRPDLYWQPLAPEARASKSGTLKKGQEKGHVPHVPAELAS